MSIKELDDREMRHAKILGVIIGLVLMGSLLLWNL